MKIDKVKIVLSVILLIIIVTVLFIKLQNKEEKVENEPVKHTVVEKLYKDNKENNCTEVIKINKKTSVDDVDDKVLLYLIFGQMEQDKILKNNINLEDYKQSALKILDKNNIPLSFDYIYKGYKYSLKDNEITRTKASCEKNFITKTYGYSGTDKLEVDIMAGYIKDGKVYDLNDKEIGTYNKDDINKLLENGTMQIYNYKKINNNYKLVSVDVK